MTMISITNFTLARPALDRRLLQANAAQSAVNAYTDTGKLQALLKAVRVGFSHFNPPVSIFRERENGSWRDWDSAVDIIRSPIDTTPATLIYTGDGKPQITAVGEATTYDLGLPAPASAPNAAVVEGDNTGSINNIERVILATQTFPETLDTGGGVNNPAPRIEFASPMSITADGEHSINLKFDINLWFNPNQSIGDPPLSKYAYIHVYRDSVEVTTVQLDDVLGDRPEDIGYRMTNDRETQIVDFPAAGTYDYTFALSLGGVSVEVNNFHGSMDVEARWNNVMRVYSATDHNLSEDQQVRIAGVTGTGTFSTSFNSKTFSVSNIVSATVFDLAAMIEGSYTSGGTWTQTWNSGEVETRAYRYTYVATINGVDYEGPASEASTEVDAGQGQRVTVSGFEAFPGTWNSPATKIRVYRFAATSSTTGQYQYVGEFDIGLTTFDDYVLGENLGESIPDPDREPPIATLQGLIELPNGGAAAFSGKTIYLAIPNYLHAWPLEYAFNAHDDIVAIGAFGSSIAIATKSQPYVLTGTDPASMTMDKVELSQPCLSKAGCVDLGYAWVYPCPDGLVLITTGRADVVTLSLFTEYQWREYNPASFKAARYDNLYVCFYEKTNGERGGFMLDPLDSDRGVCFLDFWADAIWTDPSDGSLYITRNNVISRFDDDVTELDMAWRSKEFATSECIMTCAKVEAAKYPMSISVFCDGQESVSLQVYSRQAFRIGSLRGTSWSIEVRGQHRVDGLYMAENMQELGSYQGGT